MKSLILFVCSAWFSLTVLWVSGQEAAELRRFSAPNATQAVAVDSLYFYTISNSRIVKRKKSDGEVVNAWSGPLKHLNSGIVLDGKLYCSNTNFPETPMASSLEIYDAETLEHTDNHSFGIYTGSFTWIDKKDGDWFLMFVHYDEKGKERNKGVAYSSLIRTDSTFRRKAGWTLPQKFIDHLAPMSVSGGAFFPDGRLLLSPHHYEEVYVFSFSEMGYELVWEQTIPVPFQGQGLALDPYEEKVVWGIHRQKREVVSARIDY